ncbi:MAG: hypothetical protein AABO57_21095 [Acidobacteriota bacterium]
MDFQQYEACHFALSFLFDVENPTSFFVGILMDKEDMSESNLKLLFQSISKKYPPQLLFEKHGRPLPLEARVYTDLRIPGALANNEMISVSGTRSTSSSEESRNPTRSRAFYTRTEAVELFRYNPNYPEHGTKTVILRGKE